MKRFIILIIILCSLISVYADPYQTCTCGSYPCSTSQCSLNNICWTGDFIEYTGSCLSDGFSGGYCEYDYTGCSHECYSPVGCVECVSSSDCDADYNYCVGDLVYERDYFCASYTCYGQNILQENCNDYDGNYCNGQLVESHNYYCSGGSCPYSSSTLVDCSTETTSYSDPYCSSSSVSTRSRLLGVCDLIQITYCRADADYDNTNCASGCAQSYSYNEYQNDCLSEVGYYNNIKTPQGYCKIDNSVSWSIINSFKGCSIGSWCENDLIIVDNYNNLINPCIEFAPLTSLNQSYIIQNKTFSVQTTTSQTYVPDVVCYDAINDGIYDVCHGPACDSDIQNTYCDDDACCSGSAYNTISVLTATQNIGSHTLKSLKLNTIKSYEDITTHNYVITDYVLVADIINVGDDSIDKGNTLSYDDASFGDPNIEVKCWNDATYKTGCYGSVGDCSSLCPTYDYIGTDLSSDFGIDDDIVGRRNIGLNIKSGTKTDTDTVNVCVSDFVNDVYCWTCSDGIQNDDETSIDSGGHCGTCSDGIKNGVETFIDYGGTCGTCFDGIRQDFELLDIDYGGICGNCSGVKNDDTYWALGHSISKTIPFDYGYCEEKTNTILSITSIFILLILSGFVLIIGLFVILGIILLFTVSGTLVAGVKRVSDIINKRK